MPRISGLRRTFRLATRRAAVTEEVEAELAFHFAETEAELVRRGLTPEAARSEARRRFGDVDARRSELRTIDRAHERRALRTEWWQALRQDLRYAARGLRRGPGFAVAVVTSLALAVGANTAVFGVVHAVLLRRLPVPSAEQLVAVVRQTGAVRDVTFRFDDYVALRDASGAVPLEAGSQIDNVDATAPAARDYVHADLVTGGYFLLLGVRPLLGRTLTPADDHAGAPVVVLGEATWERFFARDPAVLGRHLTLGGQPFTVVGVLPASFRGVVFNGRFDLAVPRSTATLLLPPDARTFYHVLGRHDPSTVAPLAASLDAAYQACCATRASAGADVARVRVIDVSRGVPFAKRDFRADYLRVLLLLMGGVLIVLLVACANVGNLLLARGTARRRELSVRLALGASRGRVVRQLLAECALLCVAVTVGGVLLAAWGTGALVAALPAGFESESALVRFRVGAPVLAFTVAAGVLCVLACGLGPALRATRGTLADRLTERLTERAGTRRDGAAARALVVAQVALTLLLVSGAALCVATLRNLRAVDPGFASDHLLMATVESRGTPLERDGVIPVHEAILERVRELPGIRSVGMATRVPSYGGRNLTVTVSPSSGSAADEREIDVTAITPGYLRTARTRILAGRDVAPADGRGSPPVAVVNQAFVRRFFGAEPALERTIRMALNGGETVTVVGVAQDVRFGDRRTPQDPMIYLPATQAGRWPFLALMVRTVGAPHALVPSLRAAIEEAAPGARLGRWQTMDEAFDEVLLRERLVAELGAAFAALALVLAMVGLSGVVAYGVSRRLREIGIRMALGARRAAIVALVLRESLTMVALGVALALPLQFGLGRFMRALLYGVAPTDPRVLPAVAVALLAVGAAATAFPAWRAARVHPTTSLRAD